MNTHSLEDLLRIVDPRSFSETAHGAGHRVVIAQGKATRYKPTFLRWLLGGRAERHAFVKQWNVPKAIKGWTFHWSNGTPAIRLDFDASLVIQANEEAQALRLAETLLAGPEPAGEVLYGMIATRLHQELVDMLRRCDSQELSLLDEFHRSTAGGGESASLNRAVSDAVAARLGGALFRIGFQLTRMPPMQVEVRREDTFTLADAKKGRLAKTTALLQLDNYQAFKKSGLETEEAVRRTIAGSISRAVTQLLFARRYYAVVESFIPGEDSIAEQMERCVQADARTIGYRVKMFQTFPDIAALELLQPRRIEISADEEKYSLYKSLGYVQVAIVLSVQVARDFSKLHLLIKPDAPDIAAPISARVRQICRDQLQRFDHKAFNLGFDTQIVPELEAAIVDGLASYGLVADVISIREQPTEEASRFKALRGRTVDFSAEIPPHADQVDAYPVPVAGTIEVVDLAPEGWAQFEGKDYGFRQDSQWSTARLKQMLQKKEVLLPEDNDRKVYAIEFELAEIKDRVIKTLQGALAKGPDLGRHWRDWGNGQEIEAWAKELARQAIAQEFGLAIELRAFRRIDTLTETTLRIQRLTRHELLRKTAVEAAQNEISHRQAIDQLFAQNQIERLKRAGQAEREALLLPLEKRMPPTSPLPWSADAREALRGQADSSTFGPTTVLKREIKTLAVREQVEVLQRYPSWIANQQATEVVSVHLSVSLSNDLDALTRFFMEIHPNPIRAKLVHAVVGELKSSELMAIALFHSGHARTGGYARLISDSEADLQPFDYWSLLDPDEAGDSAQRTIDINLFMVAVGLEP